MKLVQHWARTDVSSSPLRKPGPLFSGPSPDIVGDNHEHLTATRPDIFRNIVSALTRATHTNRHFRLIMIFLGGGLDGALAGQQSNREGTKKNETSPPSENGLRQCIVKRSALLSPSMPRWLFVGRPAKGSIPKPLFQRGIHSSGTSFMP